jgi:hypothetical protein
MEDTNGSSNLSTIQQFVIKALAAGATLTAAAQANGIHRVTVYRWIKNHKQFSAALRLVRAEFVLATRDRLHDLSKCALDTLLAVLRNPKSSPAVQFRTASFILQPPQMPKVGWSIPEPGPNPNANKLLDSAIKEQDYDSLACLYDIERDDPADARIPHRINPFRSAAVARIPGSWPRKRNPVQHSATQFAKLRQRCTRRIRRRFRTV